MTTTAPADTTAGDAVDPAEAAKPATSAVESEARVIGAVLALLRAEHGERQPWAGDEIGHARAELVRACAVHGGQPIWAAALTTLALDWAGATLSAGRRECGQSLLGMLAALTPEPDPEPALFVIEPPDPDAEKLRPVPADDVSSAKDATSVLTVTQIRVLTLVAQGLPNRTIGQRLYLSEDTVKTHMRHAFTRLGARDRTHAVVIALRRGLLDLPGTPAPMPDTTTEPAT